MPDVGLCFPTNASRICGISCRSRSWNNSPSAYCSLWTTWFVITVFHCVNLVIRTSDVGNCCLTYIAMFLSTLYHHTKIFSLLFLVLNLVVNLKISSYLLVFAFTLRAYLSCQNRNQFRLKVSLR